MEIQRIPCTKMISYAKNKLECNFCFYEKEIQNEKTVILNLLFLILFIIFALAFFTNFFGSGAIYFIIIMPILMLVIGGYVFKTNFKKYNQNDFNNNHRLK